MRAHGFGQQQQPFLIPVSQQKEETKRVFRKAVPSLPSDNHTLHSWAPGTTQWRAIGREREVTRGKRREKEGVEAESCGQSSCASTPAHKPRRRRPRTRRTRGLPG
jgi:hypothetical protein